MQKYTSSCIFLQRMNIIFEFYNVPSYITILCTTRANTNTIYYKSAKHHLHIILKAGILVSLTVHQFAQGHCIRHHVLIFVANSCKICLMTCNSALYAP